MHDLNDFAYFAAVADHGGFAPAGRALGIAKSKLSRRVAALEARLGLRLLHRTTRRFAITETGEAFLRHCHAMLAEAQAAEALIAEQSSAPRGTVRLACPPALLHAAVSQMLTGLLAAWPQINLNVQATNRPVDVWEGGVDFALRVRPPDAALPAEETVKPLASSPHLLVAAPALLNRVTLPTGPRELARLPTLGLGQSPEETVWRLHGPNGARVDLPHRPRLVVDDMDALLCAAQAGVGCAVLPRLLAFDALARGALLELLPGWAPPAGQIQAVFATRRGMRPAVRQALDALAAEFQALVREGRCLEAVTP